MNKESFDFIANLPLIVFGIFFAIDFIMFARAAFILLRTEGDELEIRRGRKALTNAFIALFMIVLIMGVFYLFTFIFKKGEAFQPSSSQLAEFPPPFHIAAFPPPPEYIKIGDYYFTGPWELDIGERIRDLAVSSVFCKEGEDYKNLFIGNATGDIFLRHNDYSCWVENCGGSPDNLYIAILWTPVERYGADKTYEIENNLKSQFELPCPKVEE